MYSDNKGDHTLNQLFTTRSYIIDFRRLEELYLLEVKQWIEQNEPFIPSGAMVHHHDQFRESVHVFLEYFLYRNSRWNVPHEPVPEDEMDKIHPWVTLSQNNRKRLGLANAIFRLYQSLESMMPHELNVMHWGVWSHHNIGKNRLMFTLEGDYRLMQMALRNDDAQKSENLYI